MELFIAFGSILLGIVLLGIVWFVSVYNVLVPLRETVRAARSNIETQIARRVDLYFTATRVLENGSEYERSVFLQVAKLRSRNDLSALEKAAEIGSLLAVAESNPNITATRLFANMQKMVAETETLIQQFRQQFNADVQIYNATILEFPNNLIANMLGFTVEAYYELTV